MAGTFDRKKTAILAAARETRDEAVEMMETYLEGEDDPLDGFEFLIMAEAGEVGHWLIVAKLNQRAGDAEVAGADRLGAAGPGGPLQDRHRRRARSWPAPPTPAPRRTSGAGPEPPNA